MSEMSTRFIAEKSIEDAKGQDVCVLDVRRLTTITDFMIIVNGTSDRHVKAIARQVVMDLAEHGMKPSGVEGAETGEWILVDAGDVIVHVMDRGSRDFYELEKLWSDDMLQAGENIPEAGTRDA